MLVSHCADRKYSEAKAWFGNGNGAMSNDGDMCSLARKDTSFWWLILDDMSAVAHLR